MYLIDFIKYDFIDFAGCFCLPVKGRTSVEPTRIVHCRVCKAHDLRSVLNLGHQVLTGVFPRSRETQVTTGQLELVWCSACALLQLAHSYDQSEMYGSNYGYRSGLNRSMVEYLAQKARMLSKFCDVRGGDLVVDIGSNDGTLLKSYDVPGIDRIGIDPTADKFREYYPSDIALVPTFFSRQAFESVAGTRRAKVITSIAMFYDLEDPIAFARDIESCLADDGIWHLDQSYMPSMLRMTSYDTVCHEHLEYYSLSTLLRILEASELKLLDVVMNSVNGGSFALTVAKRSSRYSPNSAVINWLLQQEAKLGLDTLAPYREFEARVFRHRSDLQNLIRALNRDGKTIFGYGASTKGNVLLQFCGLTSREIPCIADVNADKHGAYTPGTGIPIVPEAEARRERPDYFLVLPWHFKAGILEREQDYLAQGGRMIFALPEIEIV